jgi:hypothetical protein
MAEWKSFIVRLDKDNFFTFLREGAVYGSEYPSCGTSMEYTVADEVCRRLRDRGYADAVVCDPFGEPVSAASLKTTQSVSETKILEYWDDRPTKADWEHMRAVITGEDPEQIAARLGISFAELAVRMEDANKRFGIACDEMHKSTQGLKDLSECQKTEHEEQKRNNRDSRRSQ